MKRVRFTSKISRIISGVMMGAFLCLIMTMGPTFAAASGDPVTLADGSTIKDGTYQIEVTMAGGSGRATIDSPTKLVVSNGRATATISWSSAYYDYMIMDGVTYQPITVDPVSTFELPISKLDEEINVIGDTTAMSAPHEIEYTLTFHSDTLQGENSDHMKRVIPAVAILVVAAVIVGTICYRKRKAGTRNEE